MNILIGIITFPVHIIMYLFDNTLGNLFNSIDKHNSNTVSTRCECEVDKSRLLNKSIDRPYINVKSKWNGCLTSVEGDSPKATVP